MCYLSASLKKMMQKKKTQEWGEKHEHTGQDIFTESVAMKRNVFMHIGISTSKHYADWWNSEHSSTCVQEWRQKLVNEYIVGMQEFQHQISGIISNKH